MAEFNERIKKIEKVRALIREFYLYGFKSRNDYNKKSLRSYDDERRRIESYLSDCVHSESDKEGKHLTLSVDSRVLSHNPFYRVFKAKSFTDGDITLHFIIFDILNNEKKGYSLDEIIDLIDNDYLNAFNQPLCFDESTIRKKLNEYIELGLINAQKQGKKLIYYRNSMVDLEPYKDAIALYSELLPCGFLGSSLLDKFDDTNDSFLFKHHYMIQAIDSDVVLRLFEAMHQKAKVEITMFSKRKKEEHVFNVTPLKIISSVQNGRQCLLAYRYSMSQITALRIDRIEKIRLLETDENFEQYRDDLMRIEPYLWSLSINNLGAKPDHVEFEIKVNANEGYIVERLRREGRFGWVEQVDESHWRFSADVLDSKELNPWIRTFICRLTRLNYSNRTVENDFKKDINTMMRMYGIEEENK